MSDEENETNMFQNAVAFWKAKGQHVEKVNVFMFIYGLKFKKKIVRVGKCTTELNKTNFDVFFNLF